MTDKPLKESDFDIALKAYRRSLHSHVALMFSEEVMDGRFVSAVLPDGENYRVVLERRVGVMFERGPAEALAGPLQRLRYAFTALVAVTNTGPAYDDEEADEMEALAMQLKAVADEIVSACSDLGS